MKRIAAVGVGLLMSSWVGCGSEHGDVPDAGSSHGRQPTTDASGGAAGTSDAGPDGARGPGPAGAGGEDAGFEDPLAPRPEREYFPTEGWREKSPEEVGLDGAALDAAFSYAQQFNTQALLVVREGYIAREAYYRGFGADQRHESYSMAKSVTSALVGIAIDQGALHGVDARICEFYDAWDCGDADDARSRITLAHVMTLTSGLDWTEDWSAGISSDNDAVAMSSSPRPIDYVLDKPSAHEPGTHFQYSTGDPALLSGVLEAATGQTALAYAREHVFSSLGIGDVTWDADADGHTTTFAGLSATTREYAKYGFLFLERGRWNGEQVVPEAWVDVSTTPGESLVDWYGYLWHVNAPVKWDNPALPADAFAAIGVQGQHIFVVPSADLVVVRLAEDGFGASDFDAGVLLERVLAAVD